MIWISWWTNQRFLSVAELHAFDSSRKPFLLILSRLWYLSLFSIRHSSFNSSNFSFSLFFITCACQFRSGCRRSSWGQFGRRQHLPHRWQSDQLSSSWGGCWRGELGADLTSPALCSIYPVLGSLLWSVFVFTGQGGSCKFSTQKQYCRNCTHVFGRVGSSELTASTRW